MKVYSVENVYWDYSTEDYDSGILCVTENRFKAYEIANKELDTMNMDIKENHTDCYGEIRDDRVRIKVWVNGDIKSMIILYGRKDERFDDDLFE